MSQKLQQVAFIRLVAATFAAMYVISGIRFVPFQLLVGGFVGITAALIFILYPAKRGTVKERISLLDWTGALLSLGSGAYFVRFSDDIEIRSGLLTSNEVLISAVTVVLMLEVARRVLGPVLPIIALGFGLYNYFGPSLPGFLGHPGFSINRLMASSFTGTGIFGLVASVYARYVVLFVVFGALMQVMGVVEAVLDVARASTARFRAGPAKAAILSSAGIGSVVGQGAANIAITAPMTIPLMRRAGFSAERAGGLEVVASIGGQLLPPVMGAGAFLVAQFAGVSYGKVIVAALAPAILLYVGVIASAHFEAGIEGVGQVEESTETFRQTMRRNAWAFLPIALLLGLLFYGMSPFRSAFYAIVGAAVLILYRTRSPRQAVKLVYEGLYTGTYSLLGIAATTGVIGLVIAMVNLPGLPTTFASRSFALVGGSLFLAFLMVVGISLIMGMGMTVTAAYVVVAVLAAPLFLSFGVELLIAHLVVFWLSQDSSVTPPFALGSFIVAGISGGDAWKTSWYGFKYAKPLYIVPLLMIYSPYLMSSNPLEVLYAFVIAALGLIVLSAAFAGYYKAPLGWPLRLVVTGAGTAILWPDLVTSLAGLAIAGGIWLMQRQQNIRNVGYADLLAPEVIGVIDMEKAEALEREALETVEAAIRAQEEQAAQEAAE